MRLTWTDEALDDLEVIAERAPRAASQIYATIGWLAGQPFPHAFRRVMDRSDEHVLTIPPYVVIYALRGLDMEVLAIEDSRRRREPWRTPNTGFIAMAYVKDPSLRAQVMVGGTALIGHSKTRVDVTICRCDPMSVAGLPTSTESHREPACWPIVGAAPSS